MKKIILFVALSLGILGLAACQQDESAGARADAANIAAQNDVKARATAAVQVKNIDRFMARENLAKFMDRTQEPGKVWYIYERAPLTGEYVSFHVSSTYPQSLCTFMTPPEQVTEHKTRGGGSQMVVTTAMALDGVYYKGGSCPDFFFDYNTGAVGVLHSPWIETYDRPLNIKAEQAMMVTDPETLKQLHYGEEKTGAIAPPPAPAPAPAPASSASAPPITGAKAN